MRIAIALTALCTLGGCLGHQVDPSDPEGRDFALEEGSPPSASDDLNNEEAKAKPEEPANATQNADTVTPPRGSTPCGPDFKWCSDPGAPLPSPDANCCWVTAKQCYEFSKDPGLCDRLIEYCTTLPVPPAPAPAPTPYEACIFKAKDCYTWSKDPAECDAYRERCSELLEPPPKPTPESIAACYDQVADCYAVAGDYPEKCFDIRKSCEAMSNGPQ